MCVCGGGQDPYTYSFHPGVHGGTLPRSRHWKTHARTGTVLGGDGVVGALRREKSLPLRDLILGTVSWRKVTLDLELENLGVGDMGESTAGPGNHMSKGTETRRLGHAL